MPYATAEQQAERDELVYGFVAAARGGLTEYEVTRLLRARLGIPDAMAKNGLGRAPLGRLLEAGRVRYIEKPWKCPGGFRRVWYPVEEET